MKIRKRHHQGGKRLTELLLGWFQRHKRPLPWRQTSDPYRIWISEVMLQQTRAAAVIPYYERFLTLFPSVESLARADDSALLECWSGLGYYSRARNLRRAAQQIVANGWPRTSEDWLRLAGVGPYTAAAVASIAFGEPVAVLDGNVARVLARLTAHRGDVRSAQVRKELHRTAQALLDLRRPGDFNQALMELGATVCTPRNPHCPDCPVARFCAARKLGLQPELPVRCARRESVTVRLAVAIVRRGGRLLLRRRAEAASLMPGFWELPSRDGLGRGERLGSFRHAITRHQYAVSVFAAPAPRRPPPGCRWVRLDRLSAIPLTTITRKALPLAGLTPAGGPSGRSPRR